MDQNAKKSAYGSFLKLGILMQNSFSLTLCDKYYTQILIQICEDFNFFLFV